MSLFDDERVIDAALAAQVKRSHERVIEARVRAALNAALAALPREELVEKAGRAICEHDNLREREAEDRALEHSPVLLVYEDWRESFDREAEAILVAIGLIPEHVTPEEERKP